MFIKRTLEEKLKQAAERFPAITLTGPRQSGKTTLVKTAFPDYGYVSLELPDMRAFALEDPKGLLNQYAGPVIFDEIQRVPDLFSYIQVAIDEKPEIKGRFILTGSQNFLMSERVSQSLAGRTAVFKLLPFSLAELENRKPIEIEKIGVPEMAKLEVRKYKTGRQLFETLYAGFYPRIHHQGLDPREWLAPYYETYIERDVRNVVKVGDLETFSRFVRLCAGRSGQLLNLSSLASDTGISHTTARQWISVLEASYIVTLLRPYYQNFGKRLVKSPKLYFLDTGLLCYLLNIRNPDDLFHRSERGAIFEAFVISELVKNFIHRGERPDVYFWRDSAGHEIDAVMPFGDKLVAVEIKSAQTISPSFFKNLDFWFRVVREKNLFAVLIYGGNELQIRSNVVIRPWFFL